MKSIKIVRIALLWAVLVLLTTQYTFAQIQFPPALGQQTARNMYKDDLVLVYEQNFEGDVSGVEFVSNDVQVVENLAYVIDGARSARFLGPITILRFSAAETSMEPNSIYDVSFEYSVESVNGAGAYGIGVGFEWDGFDLGEFRNIAGPSNVDTVPTGKFRRQIRTGNDAQITTVITNFGATVVIDNIKISKVMPQLHRATPPLHVAGFPRIANYNLYSSFATANRNGNVAIESVESTLGLFDIVTGYEIDHTISSTDAGRTLREINPNIKIMPYHQTFVTQTDGALPTAGVGGILELFNQGLQSEWFMKKPDGSLLEEPLFPNIFQMNHTEYAPSVFGYTFNDYTQEYLTKTITPTGLWDGIHFDQSEWSPNPLLANTNPFLDEPGELPPIDLDNDGAEETLDELELAWWNSFKTYFDSLHSKLGYTQILFGNAGQLATQPSVLSKLNGMQREFMLPYDILDNGDLDLISATNWYDLMRRYSIAETHLRAPQCVSFQFTGYKLGQATGTYTFNGLPDREPTLETRDFQRMRLGLATVLMGDGFFGYDLVDNTTLPVWFDEYAVGTDGIPEKTLSKKGYLGQPIGDAVEIFGVGNQSIFNVDFEAPSQFPAGTGVDQFTFTEDPAEVIAGVRSIVVSSDSLAQGESLLVIYSLPAQFSFDVDTEYQFLMDYRILDAEAGELPSGFFSLAIQDSAMSYEETMASTAVIWEPEAGQSGTLRVSTKVRGSDAMILGYLQGNGSIVIDNIRLIEGSGGVFRRDFENGIALVNPTISPITLSQSEVTGILNRSGVSKIAGIQDPVTNTGNPVTTGITLPAADGIILLTDSVTAKPSVLPTGLSAVSTGDTTASVEWIPVSGKPSGYWIEYGFDGGDLTEFALANAQSTSIVLIDLAPGTIYHVRITSYDFLGERSNFSSTISFTTSGASPQKPEIINTTLLLQGQLVEITGADLATITALDGSLPYPMQLGGVQVLVNDVVAPVTSVSPDRIVFQVPDNIAGPTAMLDVVRDGVRSPTRIVPVGNEWSDIFSDARHNFKAYDSNSDGVLSVGEWLAAGMLEEYFSPLANVNGELSIDDILFYSGLSPHSLSEVYVDFSVTSAGDGSIENPLSTMTEALSMVVVDGTATIWAKPGDTSEVFTSLARINPTAMITIKRQHDGTVNPIRIGE